MSFSDRIARNRYLQVCIMALGSIAFGLMMSMTFPVAMNCDAHWPSGNITNVMNGNRSVYDPTGAWLVITAGAIRFIGGLVGAAIAPSLAQIKGEPKYGLAVLGLISALGYGGVLFVYVFTHDSSLSARNHMLILIVVMMFVIGLGAGGFSVFVPLMLVDAAPMKYCGAYGTVFQVGASLGTWFPSLIWAVKTRGIGDLTILAGIGLVISVAAFFLSPLLPGSTDLSPGITLTLKGHWRKVLKQCLLAMFNQMSGINYWFSSVTDPNQAKATWHWEPLLEVGLLVCPIILMFVIDRWKRLYFWQLSSCGVLLGLILLIVGCFRPSRAMLYSSSMLYCAAFGFGMSSLLWSNAAEMFQDRHLRWVGMRLVAIVHWLVGFCVLFVGFVVEMRGEDAATSASWYFVCAIFTLASAVLSRWIVGDPWYDAVREIPFDNAMPPLLGVPVSAETSESSYHSLLW